MKINFDITLSSGQQEVYELAHDKTTRYTVLRFSRQCGKTVIAEILLIEWLCKNKTYNAYVSPTFQLGRKVFGEITALLEGSGIIRKANATTLTIESVFGSTLQFFSVEGYTAIRGTTVNGLLVLDECAYYPEILPNGEHIWGNVIMPTIKAHFNTNKILLISTPCGKQGFYYEYFNRALAREKGIRQVTRTIYDDSLTTSEQIEEIKRSIPQLAFQQEFECQFLDNAMSFFTGFEKNFNGEFKYDFTSRQYFGLDPSGNGTDECILTQINDKQQAIQYNITGNFDDKYRKIASIVNQTSNLCGILVETNGLGSPFYNELQKLIANKYKMHEWETTNTSKERIISNLAIELEQGRMSFDKENTQLYSQFGTFIGTYTKNKHLKLEAKAGFKDDRIMSLAIALEAKNSIRKYTNINFGFSYSNQKIVQ